MTAAYPLWILVCDASRARLLSVEKRGDVLTLREELSHPESRAKNQDLVSDRPGRVQQSGRTGRDGSRSAMEPHVLPVEVEHERFARILVDKLEEGLNQNAYKRLAVVAVPPFLGLLRQSLSEQVNKHLDATISKDYTMVPLNELPQYLEQLLEGTRRVLDTVRGTNQPVETRAR